MRKQTILAFMTVVLAMLCLCGCKEETLWGTGTPPEATTNSSDYGLSGTTIPSKHPETHPSEAQPTEPTKPEIPTVTADIVLQTPVVIPVAADSDELEIISRTTYCTGGYLFDYAKRIFYVIDGGELVQVDAMLKECTFQHNGTEVTFAYLWAQYKETVCFYVFRDETSTEGVSKFEMVEGSKRFAVVSLYDGSDFLLDVPEGTVSDPLKNLPTHIKDTVQSLCFSPNGSYAVVRYLWGFTILDCATGALIDPQISPSIGVGSSAVFVKEDQVLIGEQGSGRRVLMYDITANIKTDYSELFEDDDLGVFSGNLIRINLDTPQVLLCDVMTGSQFEFQVQQHAGLEAFRCADGSWGLFDYDVIYVQNQSGELEPIAMLTYDE